jgi:5,10-methylenetetrahydromethanopterin reductase
LQFGISWVPDDVLGLGPLARATESAGFDVLGVPDSHFSAYREMVVCLTVVATHTDTLRLGPLVSNPASRHLLVLAQTMATLQELTGGRCFAGLGRGDELHLMGLHVPKLQELRAYAADLRHLTAGRTVRRGEVALRLDIPSHPTPVYLAGDGPRGLRLAGETADGVVIGFGLTPEAIKLALDWVQEGTSGSECRIGALDV